MFAEVFRFECRYQARHSLFWTVSATFFLLAFLAMASESVSVGAVGNNLNLNASLAIVVSHYVFSIIIMFAGVAFVATPITRDYENKTMEMFVSTGVPRLSYLFGRFAGGFLFAFLVGCICVLGTLLATFMPWLDQERVGSFSLAPYSYSIFQIMLPNIFITSCIFFTVAALTRSMLASYVSIFALIVAQAVVSFNTDVETISTTALMDPFGMLPLQEVTRYWTVFEKNLSVPEFQGTVVLNRIIWLGFALMLLALSAWRYSFTSTKKAGKKAGSTASISQKVESPRGLSALAGLSYKPEFGPGLVVQQFFAQVMSEFRGVVRSVPFYVLLLFGIMNVLGGFFGSISQAFGTPVLPVTRMMLQIVSGSFLFVIIIIVVYYAGELVQRERQHKLSEIMDATPYPNAMMILAKIVGLWFVITTLLLIYLFTAILLQAFNGYYHFEIGTYLFGLFVTMGWGIYLLAVIAIFLQVLVDNKFLGMLLTIMLVVVLSTLNALDFEHSLYQFGVPNVPFSDMNSWGHYLEPMFTIGMYWTVFSGLLVIAGHLFMRRGEAMEFRSRLSLARQRITPSVRLGGLVGIMVMASLGVWIYYNTNVLNQYQTADELEELQAEYEKSYKQYEKLKFPAAIGMDVDVDIFPEERRLESRGTISMENQTQQALDELHFSIGQHLNINSFVVPDSNRVENNEKFGYYRYKLNQALLPGEKIEVKFDLTWANPGFKNSRSNTRLVQNGTFVDNTMMMPTLGYNAGAEISDNNVRRKYDLEPVQRAPKLGDADALMVNQLQSASRTAFRTTVSTSEDQIAISPGYLQREWVEDGRRYFEYKMDDAIWPFVSFLSAEYEVVRDSWRDQVDLEVYFHPGHDFNVERMIYASKKGLDYFSEEFSPYQYRQFRILEFPSYSVFAQSFPNTIPFSEAIGFIADLSDDKYIDYVFYVTAHELAHQWWAHQVIGANMQGATIIVETLAQYSALMVMEREYGPEKMRRFLKYELDNYLSNRGSEQIEELPLNKVEGQGYIHYRKGSVVMYALKDAIGEQAVNAALRSFIAKHAFGGAPFPMSTDLINEFRAVAGAEHQQLITDLFERISIFDLKVAEATTVQLDNGKWKVEIDIEAKQFEADGEGRETEVPMSIELDLAIFPEPGDELGDDDLPDPILLERRIITGGDLHLEFELDQEPARVGIDPYHKMVDRNPNDNLKLVSGS